MSAKEMLRSSPMLTSAPLSPENEYGLEGALHHAPSLSHTYGIAQVLYQASASYNLNIKITDLKQSSCSGQLMSPGDAARG